MFRNYLKTSLRHLSRQKAYAAINIIGLALGLATCIQIFLFVQDELSYDRFHENAENIYRIENEWTGEGEVVHWAATTGDIIPTLTSRYPEILAGVKINFSYFPHILEYNDQQYSEKNVIYADSSFFKVFSFPMLAGNPETALSGPEKMVMTKTIAKKYFGDEEAIGQIIRMGDNSYKVTGVVEDIPDNSHFHFDIAIAMDHLRSAGRNVDRSGPAAFYSYIRMPDKQTADKFTVKFNSEIYETYGFVVDGDSTNMPEGWTVKGIVKPITDIHLKSHEEKEIEANGDISNVYVFSAVAIFILIIACINYMNLATARSTRRSREVGLRKVMGAQRNNIFNQFMVESFTITLISMIIALLLVWIFIPWFNEIAGKNINLNLLENTTLVLTLLGILIITSLLAGSYPAIYLSKFSPLKVLKSTLLNSKGKNRSIVFRRILVVTQFAISILLIIGTITVYRQISYIQDKKLGFSKEQVAVLSLPSTNPDENHALQIRNELKKIPEVLYTSTASGIPGQRMPFLTYRFPGNQEEEVVENNDGSDIIGARSFFGDHDLLKVLGIDIIEGRDFSEEFSTDDSAAFILNEAAIEAYEIENPIGERVEYTYGLRRPRAGQIIGVAKNFHYASLHSEVEPLIIHLYKPYNKYLLIKMKTDKVKSTLQDIEEVWMDFNPAMPMEYFFLDSFYDNMYKSEMSMGKVIMYFTILAIVIACLGLFGLVSFIVDQKTKEIGIRKVLGASVTSIVKIISWEFLILISISNVIAWFPAYYYLNKWLDEFAFRTSLSIWIFVATTLISLLIAIITVSSQAIKAASSNPVDAIKYE